MTQFSRVKKYEQLRNSIDAGKNITNLVNDPLTQNTNEKVDYVPTHRKNYEETNTDLNDSFKNEYLDSFIQEVREYNMKKGIREYEDTKLDILQQLNSKTREKRYSYIETMEENESKDEIVIDENNRNEETLEISKAVFELLNEENNANENDDVEVEPIEEVQEEVTLTPVKEIDENELKEEFLEHTRELKAQVESYKEELTEMSDDVHKNNRLLNVIIVILILALLSVCGVVVYWLFKGGII